MEKNPFLSDMPWVTIVTQVRIVNGVEVETPQEDCVRVWGRVGSGREDDRDIMESNPVRIIPDPDGLDKQRDF